MTVHPLPRRTTRPPRPFTSDPVVQGLLFAVGICRDYGIPEEAHVHVHGGGRNVTFDLTYCPQPAHAMRYLSSVLALELKEFPAETPDGCAAQELRCSWVHEGALLTIRATIPLIATWPVAP